MNIRRFRVSRPRLFSRSSNVKQDSYTEYLLDMAWKKRMGIGDVVYTCNFGVACRHDS